jgi:hypothetical protein
LPLNPPTLLEELEYTRLLVDERAWEVAGSELRRRDPARYVAILKIAEEICSIHRSPLEPISMPGSFVVPNSNGDDFD